MHYQNREDYEIFFHVCLKGFIIPQLRLSIIVRPIATTVAKIGSNNVITL